MCLAMFSMVSAGQPSLFVELLAYTYCNILRNINFGMQKTDKGGVGSQFTQQIQNGKPINTRGQIPAGGGGCCVVEALYSVTLVLGIQNMIYVLLN